MARRPTPWSLSLDLARLGLDAQVVFATRLFRIATGSMTPAKLAGMASEKVMAFQRAQAAAIAAPDLGVAADRVIRIYGRQVAANRRRLGRL